MANQQFLSTTQLAEILGVSRIAVYKKIVSGEIKALKVGRNFIIDRHLLGDILNQKVTPQQEIEIEKAVKKTVKEYGQTLKLLGAT